MPPWAFSPSCSVSSVTVSRTRSRDSIAVGLLWSLMVVLLGVGETVRLRRGSAGIARGADSLLGVRNYRHAHRGGIPDDGADRPHCARAVAAPHHCRHRFIELVDRLFVEFQVLDLGLVAHGMGSPRVRILFSCDGRE